MLGKPRGELPLSSMSTNPDDTLSLMAELAFLEEDIKAIGRYHSGIERETVARKPPRKLMQLGANLRKIV